MSIKTQHPFVRAGFGLKRGGGPTTGQRSAQFRVLLPDGTAIIKRKFKMDAVVDAQASVYALDGKWYVADVFERNKPPRWVVETRGNSTVDAERIG